MMLDLVADGLSFPTSLTFDAAGTIYVAESGLPFGGAPPGGRVWRLDGDGRRSPLAEGLRPPVNGLTFHERSLYVSEGGHPGGISRLDLDGKRTTVLDNLPGPGNYHTNMVAFAPNGKLSFSQGAMTNSGIVGLDAYELGWLRRLPHAHDIPGYDIVLTGVDVETPNPLSQDHAARAQTGAFSPFGTCTRPVGNAPDLLYEIHKGAWYGWPDFIGGDPITDDRFRPERGPAPSFLLANHDELPPPEQPLLRFPPHVAALKFAVAPTGTEWAGQIFVALFGDEAPMTAPAGPRAGRSLVRVDLRDWSLHPFLSEGLNRPIDVRFGPSGALYVLDFGYFEIHAGRGLIARKQTDKLWRCQMRTKES